jgi:hypothetical protein
MTEIDTLRRDFIDTRSMMLHPDVQEWTPEQAREIGAGIAECVKSMDAGELRFWCDWFALRAEAARGLSIIARTAIKLMRAA